MAITLSAPPTQTPLFDLPMPGQRPTWLITRVWENWFRSLAGRAQTAASSVSALRLTGQSASIGLTSLVVLGVGLYRASYRFRLSTAATTSSSVQVGFTTTDGGVIVTNSGAAYTGNATTAPQCGSFLLRADPGVPVQYFVTYGSVGATPAVYELDLVLEQL